MSSKSNVWPILANDGDSDTSAKQFQGKPAYLYRHFDRDGRLLYVGISLKHLQRLAEHKATAHWYDRIARVEIERLSTWDDALAAEAKAIVDENPECNLARPPGYYIASPAPPPPPPPPPFTGLDRIDQTTAEGRLVIARYNELVREREERRRSRGHDGGLSIDEHEDVLGQARSAARKIIRLWDLQEVAKRLRAEWLASDRPSGTMFDRIMRAENMAKRAEDELRYE